MHKLWKAIALASAVLGTPAWAFDLAGPNGGYYSLKVSTLKDAKSRGVIFQQYDFSCGSAALATLLTYHYRQPVSEQQVFRAMFEQGDQQKIQREGFSLLDMKRYLQSHGFQADGFEAPLEQLAAANLPAIVLITDNGYNHFVVIKGIRQGRVLIGDPALGLRAMPISDFKALWRSGILFVIHSHQNVALANIPNEWAAKPFAPIASGEWRDINPMPLLRRQPGDLF